MAIQLSTGLRSAMLDTADFKTLFANSIIDIYSGDQPASADDTEAGTHLLRITLSSGAFTPGEPDNGLNFDAAVAGVIAKIEADTWSGENLESGTAGWFRFYDNSVTTGASTEAVRFDGSVDVSEAELNMPSTSLVATATTTIDAFEVTLPASV